MTLLSREWRLNHLYKIINKQGKEVTFKLNAGQKRLFEKENELREKYGKVWLKLLKARQIGFTTYKLIDKLDKAMFYSNTTVNIVAHRQDKLQEIFKRLKYTFDKVPDVIKLQDGRERHKPKPKYDNRNELYFKDTNSTIKITLDSRSGTLTDCHISEGAFIDKFRDMLRATIPSAEQADITIETTANGMNEFKDFWDSDDRFHSMFFPRFEQEEYREKAPEGYTPISELQYLQDKYNLDNDQMYRYEVRYKADKMGTLQEYPSEPIDAFISSGHPFYNLQTINSYPINNDYEEDDIRPGLRRYRKKAYHDYIIGIDFAEGLDHGDKTTIRVRARNLKLIATYRGTIEPGDVTKIVNYLWNNGIRGTIAPERNNHGHTFLHASKSYERYKHIYTPLQDTNDFKKEQKNKRGWHTNMVTRPLMLDEHKQAINDGLLEMDDELHNECKTFVYKNGKPQADDNCHDDVIFGDAICLQMLKTPSIIKKSKIKNRTSSLKSRR